MYSAWSTCYTWISLGSRPAGTTPHFEECPNGTFLLNTSIHPTMFRLGLARSTIQRSVCAGKIPCQRTLSFYNTHVAGLSDEQTELRDAVATWADKELAPRAAEIDQSNKSPMDLWPKLGDMGLLGITVPEADGGLGKGYFEHTLVMEGE